jgi:hypothetical protein
VIKKKNPCDGKRAAGIRDVVGSMARPACPTEGLLLKLILFRSTNMRARQKAFCSSTSCSDLNEARERDEGSGFGI